MSKPLTDPLAEAESLISEVDGRIRLMVNENRRFRSDFRQIAAWLSEGRLGDVLQCQMIMNRSGYLPDKNGRRPAIYRSPAKATLRRLLILGVLIHQYDMKKEYQTCFSAAIAHFTECIRTGKPFESDPRDNLKTLRLVEAAYITSGLDPI